MKDVFPGELTDYVKESSINPSLWNYSILYPNSIRTPTKKAYSLEHFDETIKYMREEVKANIPYTDNIDRINNIIKLTKRLDAANPEIKNIIDDIFKSSYDMGLIIKCINRLEIILQKRKDMQKYLSTLLEGTPTKSMDGSRRRSTRRRSKRRRSTRRRSKRRGSTRRRSTRRRS